MKQYEVGKCYSEFKGLEGVMMNFTNSGVVITCRFTNPTKNEIENFKSGKIQYKLLYMKNVIVFLIKVGEERWMDIPLFGNEDIYNAVNTTDSNVEYLVTLFLSDNVTGEIKVMRAFSINNNTSKFLNKSLEMQKDKNFSKREYDLALNEIYINYSTQKLLK
ncbi:hypothetical protein, partial [Peptostreptococcus sp. D1]|uniref:hypothetical protein n=1 Tax=Peptostreptococcus sp. D1 TaxID=72304 RepID=UPI0008DF8A18